LCKQCISFLDKVVATQKFKKIYFYNLHSKLFQSKLEEITRIDLFHGIVSALLTQISHSDVAVDQKTSKSTSCWPQLTRLSLWI